MRQQKRLLHRDGLEAPIGLPDPVMQAHGLRHLRAHKAHPFIKMQQRVLRILDGENQGLVRSHRVLVGLGEGQTGVLGRGQGQRERLRRTRPFGAAQRAEDRDRGQHLGLGRRQRR